MDPNGLSIFTENGFFVNDFVFHSTFEPAKLCSSDYGPGLRATKF